LSTERDDDDDDDDDDDEYIIPDVVVQYCWVEIVDQRTCKPRAPASTNASIAIYVFIYLVIRYAEAAQYSIQYKL